jgi:hypothetical protein
LEQLVGLGGAFAVLALLLAQAGVSIAIPWGLVALGGEYAAWFALRGEAVDTRAPLYGAGLLLVGELSYWALDRRSAAPADLELDVRRLVALIVVLGGAVAAGTLLLAVSALSIGGGVVVEAVGLAGAVALLALVATLVRAGREVEPDT